MPDLEDLRQRLRRDLSADEPSTVARRLVELLEAFIEAKLEERDARLAEMMRREVRMPAPAGDSTGER